MDDSLVPVKQRLGAEDTPPFMRAIYPCIYRTFCIQKLALHRIGCPTIARK